MTSFAPTHLFKLGMSAVLVAFVLFASVCCAYAQSGSVDRPQMRYTLTIRVDEGRNAPVGHVFVRLSDGTNSNYYGFYPNEAWTETFGKGTAPVGPGSVKDDSQHSWNVERTYNITRLGFDDAVRVVEKIRSDGRYYCLIGRHCGDFAEQIANAAGVPIHLPPTAKGRDRPALFADYLRRHGGVENPRVSTHVAPTPMADTQRQQLVAAMEEALEAHRRCVDQVPACIDRCLSSASSMSGSYISNVQACTPSCNTMCDALNKAFWAASKRLSDYDLAQSRSQVDQAQRRSR